MEVLTSCRVFSQGGAYKLWTVILHTSELFFLTEFVDMHFIKILVLKSKLYLIIKIDKLKTLF